ncbi:MAG: HAD-IB family hydrolase [Acidimicrobiales bacterium]|jgi:phosphatidylglycerophosphatase C|nr:HAD-IB family hydrolase [Acidimicrobiales bacterium]MDP6299188.1 HAD-IB family hydrolase [Acidimicrobiales bacterium]HJM29405.1 HAD-IB family hydrolase [Acidimicrobiales bacterium]HJM96586.1 HAD-IB family hydrolase [Acidimicrobiales bacterium]
MTLRRIAAFDFDGTITRRDTLFPFLRQYGTSNLLQAAVLTLRTRKPQGWRESLKANVLRKVFLGKELQKLEHAGKSYAANLPRLYRDEVLSMISYHRDAGHELVLVTASLGCYARPAAEELGFDHVIAVELVSNAGRLSGEMSGRNVRGSEKARQLREWLGSSDAEIWAYGNSQGDKEMLSMANHSKWV